VTHENPARGGESLFVYAYGLGAVDRPYPADRPHQPELFPRSTQPLTLNFTFEGGAPLAERRVTGASPVYAGLIGQDGLYQINFTMPPAPANLPQCSGPGDFNVTVTVVGTDSADAARICVVAGL
jgi:uncharacterized protein (TIGR03437 family)